MVKKTIKYTNSKTASDPKGTWKHHRNPSPVWPSNCSVQWWTETDKTSTHQLFHWSALLSITFVLWLTWLRCLERGRTHSRTADQQQWCDDDDNDEDNFLLLNSSMSMSNWLLFTDIQSRLCCYVCLERRGRLWLTGVVMLLSSSRWTWALRELCCCQRRWSCMRANCWLSRYC